MNGIFLLILFGVLSGMEMNMPLEWRPKTQILNPGCEGNNLFPYIKIYNNNRYILLLLL